MTADTGVEAWHNGQRRACIHQRLCAYARVFLALHSCKQILCSVHAAASPVPYIIVSGIIASEGSLLVEVCGAICGHEHRCPKHVSAIRSLRALRAAVTT